MAVKTKPELTEVRWHGRGGQGAKTAAYLLAESAMGEGKFIQAFPEFGPERGGAPLTAYTRISDRQIRLHCGITHPEVVVVLDPTLLGTEDVCEGLHPDGILLINSEQSPAEIRKQLHLKNHKIFTLPATRIAQETIGRPIPNTPMIGALAKVGGILQLDRIKEDVRRRFSARFRPEVVEGNIKAIQRAYEEVKTE